MSQPVYQSYFSNHTGPIDIDDLLAFHAQRFGGFKMEDEPVEEEQPDPESGDAPADDEPTDEPVEDEPRDDEPADDEGDKLSHEDALKALTKTRSEAANWRTKFRDLEKKLEGAKTAEEIDAVREEIKAEYLASEQALVVENVALKHRLPDDLAQVLTDAAKGKTRDELEAHAKVLAKYAPGKRSVEDPAGGLNPSDEDESFDAAEMARNARRNRY